MRYSCKAVVGHGQVCEPNYQCDVCAAKQKYIPRIEQLEAIMRKLVEPFKASKPLFGEQYLRSVRVGDQVVEELLAALEGKDD